MLSGLAAMALLLSAMGLYAVMAHAVSARTVEIGVRMALGAAASDVRWQILRQGLTVAVIGIGAGALPAYAGARLVSRFLYGVTALDPVSGITSVAILLVAASAAALIPAIRASRVAPLVALRHDAE
jgi:putative ABC transport system permease protein